MHQALLLQSLFKIIIDCELCATQVAWLYDPKAEAKLINYKQLAKSKT